MRNLFLIGILLWTPAILSSQTDDTLIDPLEPIPYGDERGTFHLSSTGYMVCGNVIPSEEPSGIGPLSNRLVSESIEAAKIPSATARDSEWKRIATLLEEQIKKDPQFYPFRYNIGRIYLLLRLPKRAEKHFRQSIALIPDFYMAHIHLGDTYAKLGEDRAALEHYKIAAKKNPFSLLPLLSLGTFYLERRLYTQAAYYFEYVLKRDSENNFAKTGLAKMFLARGDTPSARAVLSSIQVENLDGTQRTDYDLSVHFYLADIATQELDYDEAVRQYDKLLAHPEDAFFLEYARELILKRREIVAEIAAAGETSLEK